MFTIVLNGNIVNNREIEAVMLCVTQLDRRIQGLFGMAVFREIALIQNVNQISTLRLVHQSFAQRRLILIQSLFEMIREMSTPINPNVAVRAA